MDDDRTETATTAIRPMTRALRCAAVTLLAAAVALIAVAALLRNEPGVRPGVPDWLPWYAAVPALLIARIGVISWRTRSTGERLGRGFRIWCVLLAASAVGPTAWAVGLTIDNIDGGLPVPAPFVWLIGCAAGVVGAGLLAVAGVTTSDGRTAGRGPVWRWRAVGSAGAVIAVVVPVAVAVLVVDTITLDASTASPTEPAPVPTAPRAQAWDWRPPDGRQVRDVVAAGAGVVVLIDDGVVALDGTTGQERWHYRRTGATAIELNAGFDGSVVTVGFRSADPEATGTRVVALSAMTGRETGFDEIIEFGALSDHSLLGMTDNALVGTESDRFELEYEYSHGGVGQLTGFDLSDGRPLWDYTKPGECRAGGAVGNPVAASDAAVIAMVCAPGGARATEVTVTLLGLDERTGAERWRFERRVPSRAEEALGEQLDLGWNVDVYLEVSDDGTAIDFIWEDTAADDETDAVSRVIVDAATGEVLLDDEAFPGGDPEQFSRRWLVTSAADDVDDEAAEYTITRFGDRSDQAAQPLRSAGRPVGFTADAMFSFGPDPGDERSGMVLTPWDGGPERGIDIDLVPGTEEDLDDFRLVPAPGAIVAWFDRHRDSDSRIVGLA